MYKLTLGSIDEIKPREGFCSGTIKTDRVVIVDSDGKYLQVDGNWGTDLKQGLVRTWSSTHGTAETDYLKTIHSSKSADTAAVWIYDGIMVLQSAYSSMDDFIEELVDNGVIVIQGYANPTYKLNAVTVKTAGSGYTDASVVVSVPGRTGDTAGTITCTITEGAISAAAITTAGSYQVKTATQTVAVGDKGGELTVTMTKNE